ncbi:MAG: hypothetical protein AB7D38_12195 [Sulfurimonas sp.]|uniref:phage tail tip fiber protein n=1 Tax=Sulfurimonas sp. TaxID=2022749 RepID=UPI003D1133E9
MADNISVPINIEDPVILRRFLNELVGKYNSTSNKSILKEALGLTDTQLNNFNDAVTLSFLEAIKNNIVLQNTIKQLVKESIVEQVLITNKDVAKVSQEFGAFYLQAIAAAWYGLTVKAGNVISGFTIGSIDTDTTTPGTEGSFLAFNADQISFAKAMEDISDPAELAYLIANNLPYGTMYNSSTNEIIPAFFINWDGSKYDIYFNGIVNFTRVDANGQPLSSVIDTINTSLAEAATSITTLEETNDGVVNSFYQPTPPTAGMSYGDWWVDTDNTPIKAYRYEDTDGKNVNTLDWRDSSNSIIGKAYIQAVGAQATADGKITTFYGDISGMVSSLGNDGDIYVVKTTKTQYIKAAGSWVYIDPATAINGNTTTINGGKITTGSITATQIGTNTIIAYSANIADGVIINAHIANGSIDNAKIANGSIDNAKIANGSIDNAKIADLAVDSAKVTDLQSSVYIPGSIGWSIKKDGNAEFNNAVFRGTIAAASIVTGNLTVTGTWDLAQIPNISVISYDGVPSLSLSIPAAPTLPGSPRVFHDTVGRTFYAWWPVDIKIILSVNYTMTAGNFDYRFRVVIGSTTLYTENRKLSLYNTGYGSLEGSFVYAPGSNFSGDFQVYLEFLNNAALAGTLTHTSGYAIARQIVR